MTKEEFNNLDIHKQVKFINDSIISLGSLRKACDSIGIAKSTVLNRFTKQNYSASSSGLYSLNMEKEFNSIMEQKGSDLRVEVSAGNENSDNLVVNGRSDVGTLDSSIAEINFRIKQIKRNFVELGKVFKQIRDSESFKLKGFSNIYDFAVSEFNIKRTLVQNLITVYEKFHLDLYCKQYDSFSFSQLVEMTTLSQDVLETVTPEDTVKQIREKKKSLKKDIIPKSDSEIDGQISVDEFVDDLEKPISSSEDSVITLKLLRSDVIELLTLARLEFERAGDKRYSKLRERLLKFM